MRLFYAAFNPHSGHRNLSQRYKPCLSLSALTRNDFAFYLFSSKYELGMTKREQTSAAFIESQGAGLGSGVFAASELNPAHSKIIIGTFNIYLG